MYTGEVHSGGPADVRELPRLIITKLSVGQMDNNAYLLRCRRTDEQLLIDAANEPERLLDLVGASGLATVVTTHAHADHWQGLVQVAAVTGAATLAHPEDADALPVAPDRLVDDGDVITVGEVELRVVHTPGHTPGSICLVHEDPEGHPHLFSGDTLFPGGVGKSTPETFDRLIDGVEEKLFGHLPDETWVYPGHGADTTLGAERGQLPAWRARRW